MHQSAIDMMINARIIGRRMQESADQYIDAMQGTPRPAIGVGRFYRTFCGSIALVARAINACDCGQVTAAEEALLIPGMPAIEPGPQPKFVTTVIRGGHGILQYCGDGPGSCYFVDAVGWVIFGPTATLAAELKASVSRAMLAVGALSLEREIAASFGEMEA